MLAPYKFEGQRGVARLKITLSVSKFLPLASLKSSKVQSFDGCRIISTGLGLL